MAETRVMQKGWVAVYGDGKTIAFEDPGMWKKIPKKDMVRLVVKWFDRSWFVDQPPFLCGISGSVSPFIPGGDFQVESRYIGYYEGAQKIIYRVDEYSGMMRVETK
jgi:hypothetical protein